MIKNNFLLQKKLEEKKKKNMSTTIIKEIDEINEKEKLILCCLCGTSIEQNEANMCSDCIKSQVDLSDTFQKHDGKKKKIIYLKKYIVILFCKYCERYHQPPTYWVKCSLESKELLQLCLKKLKGLSKVKLIDASFIWTEPHSRRIKIKVVIQKVVLGGVKVQQPCVIEFSVEYLQWYFINNIFFF
jgi:nonsense-mediated mRNA decay protein 3